MDAPYYNGAPGEHLGDRDRKANATGAFLPCPRCGERAFLRYDEDYHRPLCRRCQDDDRATREEQDQR